MLRQMRLVPRARVVHGTVELEREDARLVGRRAAVRHADRFWKRKIIIEKSIIEIYFFREIFVLLPPSATFSCSFAKKQNEIDHNSFCGRKKRSV